jgi:hypothetical protein
MRYNVYADTAEGGLLDRDHRVEEISPLQTERDRAFQLRRRGYRGKIYLQDLEGSV